MWFQIFFKKYSNDFEQSDMIIPNYNFVQNT